MIIDSFLSLDSLIKHVMYSHAIFMRISYEKKLLLRVKLNDFIDKMKLD